VLDVIGAGYQIPFHTTPPTTNLQQHRSSVSKEDEQAIDQEIAALLDKQAIEPATAAGFRSRLFTIVKKTGDLRPVLNLRPLNQYVEQESFKMETTKTVCSMILKNDFLTSIDLKDAFLHVPISPNHRRYLQFQWKGKIYQFRTLPFGLSLSPLVFTKVLRPLLRWARRKGIRLSAYLDDLLIMARTEEQSRRNTRLVREKLMALGFIINEKKSSLEPSQTLDHLGFTFDTRKMVLSVPKSKLRDLRREATKMRNKGHTTLKNLTSFVGKAMATTMAVFPARLMTRNLLSLKNSALRRPGAQWTDTVLLTAEAEENLNWWINSLKEWNGNSWIQSPPEMDVYTDASDKGWGIVIGNKTWSGLWSPEEAKLHINWKEIQTVFLAVTLPVVQGKMVNVIVDNTSTLSYINKFGGTRSPPLMEAADRVWRHCLATGTRLQTTYVPSIFNPADSPSRRLQHQLEWSLDPRFFQQLNWTWGPHHVDLFASPLNTQLPHFFSWRPHPWAMATDAFRHSWRRLGNLYLCPPWNLIPQVLQRLRQEKLEATLIAPFWPSAAWFPLVQEMSICPPVPIPRSCVLPPPGSASHILQKNPHWLLGAWRVSGRV